jgi:hypothetical protein
MPYLQMSERYEVKTRTMRGTLERATAAITAARVASRDCPRTDDCGLCDWEGAVARDRCERGGGNSPITGKWNLESGMWKLEWKRTTPGSAERTCTAMDR